MSKKETKSSSSYISLDQREHILLRPDTYIGSTKVEKCELLKCLLKN